MMFAVAAILAFSIQFSAAQNPISPSGTFIPDPSARVGQDGKMYVYGSLDTSDGTYCSNRYHLLYSDDLRNWKLVKDIFTCGEPLYAPDVCFAGGKCHLFYDCPGGSEWTAVSDNPEGPFEDISRIEGPDQIDPCIFIDDDGQAYYFWGQISAKGAKMNPDLKTLDLSTFKDSLVTEGEHWFHEGGFVFKRGKFYYFVYASLRRRNKPTCLSYAMSTSPLGPYEYKGEIIDNAGCDPGVWNNHGSVVEYKGKWYVFYHRSTHGDRFMRKACVEPITFRENGTIVEAEMTSQGAGAPLDAFSTTAARRACLLEGEVRITLDTDNPGREILTHAGNGDWAAFKYFSFNGRQPRRAIVRVRPKNGGRIWIGFDQTYAGEKGGTDVPAGNGERWKELSFDIDGPGDTGKTHAVFVHFSGEKDCELFDLDWIKFE